MAELREIDGTGWHPQGSIFPFAKPFKYSKLIWFLNNSNAPPEGFSPVEFIKTEEEAFVGFASLPTDIFLFVVHVEHFSRQNVFEGQRFVEFSFSLFFVANRLDVRRMSWLKGRRRDGKTVIYEKTALKSKQKRENRYQITKGASESYDDFRVTRD